MRILVTGGSGLLGNTILRQLTTAKRGGQDIELVALVRRDVNQSGEAETVFADIDCGWVIDDLGQGASEKDGFERNAQRPLEQAIADCDAVIHSAGLIHLGFQRMDESMAVNRDGTRRIVRACLGSGAKLVHVGTVNTLALGNQNGPADETTPTADGHRPSQIASSYVVSKRAGVDEVRRGVEAGLAAVIVHPGFMLGPWDWKPSSGRMIVQVSRAWRPVTPAGGCSVCDSRDVAEGTINAMRALAEGSIENGRHYILAGQNWTYYRLWSEIAARCGTRLPVTTAGAVIRNLATASLAAASRFRGPSAENGDVNPAAFAMSNQFHWYDSSRAIAELGYQHRPATESLDAAVHWLRQIQCLGQ